MYKLFMILAATATLTSGQWNTQYEADKYGIVHLFEWHWDTIADECETFLAQHKIAGVQISPPNENRVIDGRPWWERYQPISYILDTRSGDRDALIDMVNRCNAVGVRIYADIVVNHMCGAGGTGYGTAGDYYDANSEDFPEVPYSYLDFNDGNCYTASGSIENYQDANQVRNCKLTGLLDLNQGKDYVRGKIEDYMNDLISLGVAGFRVDACKHMWPGDLEVIFGSLNDLRSDIFGAGQRPFVYQEVIDQGGEPVTADQYFDIGRVTEFNYGLELASNKDHVEYLENFGEAWGLMPDKYALVFLNNHDNQRGSGGGGTVITFEDPYNLKIFTAYMLAWPYGIPRVMSSYYFSYSDEGPPENQRSVNEDGSCGNGWVCEHRWRPITNMFAFGQAVKGTAVVNWWDNGDNQIAFGRAGKGFLAINKAGYNMNKNLQTGLPAGSYCNVILGDFYDGKCAGECITVDSTGYANINIGTTDDPMVAIHVNAMTSECNVGGGSTGGGNGGGGGSTTCTDCTCPDSEKVDCGELASTEETCEASGCIWCPLAKRANVPWCIYKAAETTTSSPSSSSSSSAPSTSCTDCDCTEKIDCGELATTAETCAASGCLWCPLEDGSTDPWCFYVSSGATTATTTSSGGSSTTTNSVSTTTTSSGGCDDCSCTEKYDCGYYGIDETQCIDEGCLWCPAESGSNDPWCILASGSNNGGTPTCAVEEDARQDCGYMGIQQAECESMGCCWVEDNVTGVPWCYYKA